MNDFMRNHPSFDVESAATAATAATPAAAALLHDLTGSTYTITYPIKYETEHIK